MPARPRGVTCGKFTMWEGLVELDDETSNRNKAATAARALARPRGGVEQSETAVSGKMVGRAGLEPATNPL